MAHQALCHTVLHIRQRLFWAIPRRIIHWQTEVLVVEVWNLIAGEEFRVVREMVMLAHQVFVSAVDMCWGTSLTKSASDSGVAVTYKSREDFFGRAAIGYHHPCIVSVVDQSWINTWLSRVCVSFFKSLSLPSIHVGNRTSAEMIGLTLQFLWGRNDRWKSLAILRICGPWSFLSAMSLVLKSGSYSLVSSFLQVGDQAHPLDVECHGSRMDEFAV
jgi:hypothetical protein